MLKHPRFIPLLGVSESLQVLGSKQSMIEYIEYKGYEYIDLDSQGNSIDDVNPDILFYYKPYELNYRHGLYFDYHLKSILCSVNYGFSVSDGPIAFKHAIKEYAWRDFVENEAVIEAMRNSGKNVKNKRITGIPLQDILNRSKDQFDDPWKSDHRRKRIIYAPHHSFKGTNSQFIEYATFLQFGEFMLEMAKRYANETEWIFKPHPSLKYRLIEKWGEEQTEAYYQAWEKLPNARIELGEYYEIFAYSDAMIHDCSSFMAEYMFAHNPVLFLQEKEHTAKEMKLSRFGYDAYKAHYHASTKEEIENFIKEVISGNDPKENDRYEFMKKYLSTPNGKTASENIINEILGE